MVIELGHFALILAVGLAVLQSIFGLVGPALHRVSWAHVTRNTVAGQLVFTVLAFGCLAYGFLVNDFSVRYVASNSNSALPTMYRFAAVWGAHEGSLLLWFLVLACWSAAVAAFSRNLPIQFSSRVLGVLGLVSVGFGLFILLTSNPFERLLPAAADGNDLNPLLQDPAFAAHPPILYMGYVGMSVPFAFAVAAMIEGKMDSVWARWVRPWTVLAWMFLTIGITLGSWWAYYELGWGGWWFWDPVENASFMPWLVGTALIHSLAVTEKRGIFKSWTLILAIIAFSLSLLGTFLVRSGVIVSVHAFASDPRRGIFILAFLSICVVGSLALYAWRASHFKPESGFAIVSRESFLLLNNILLVVAAAVVLISTLYPLFLEALRLGQSSVGAPFLWVVFPIPTLPLVALVGFGMHASWKRADFSGVRNQLALAGIIGLVVSLGVVLPVYGWSSIMTVIGVTIGVFIAISALIEPVSRWRKGHSVSAATVGMCLAHFGVAIFVLGISVVRSYSTEQDLKMAPGDTVKVAGYEFTYVGIHDLTGPNYQGVEADIKIARDGSQVTLVHPQKRIYRVQRNPMTEAAIVPRLHRDLFVALGDELGDGRTWSMRIQYKPFLRFLWLGTLLMASGGLIAAFDRRYRTARVKAPSATGEGALARESA